ncbi:MAG: hypothetical protein JRI55_02970 [Deltaproteobacteria bacterium]|nr:hypothetical protein [Deltaproteobacteria bacterium]
MPLSLVSILVATALCGCDGSDEPSPGTPVGPDISPFENGTLNAWPFFNDPALDLSEVRGVQIAGADSGRAATLTFVDAQEGAVGSPISLSAAAIANGAEPRFVSAGQTLFDTPNLTIVVHVADDAPEGPQLHVGLGSESFLQRDGLAFPGTTPMNDNFDTAQDPEVVRARRLDYRDHWISLQANDQLSDVERFASLLDYIALTLRASHPDHGAGKVAHNMADDMVDLFLGDDHDFERHTLMRYTFSELEPNEHILDPPRLTGFKASLRNGEGRFRHFAANVALPRLLGPGMVVANLIAAFFGNDWDPESDPTGDVAADLETNDLGRAFWDFLLQSTKEELSQGVVREWILDHFGEASTQTSCATGAPGTDAVASISMNLTGETVLCDAVAFDVAVADTPHSSDDVPPKAGAGNHLEIEAVGAAVLHLSQDRLDASLAVGGTYPCGSGTYGWTICTGDAQPLSGGDYLVALNVTMGTIPLDDTVNQYQYGFVFDADGISTNNFVPGSLYPNDFFGNTDLWYQANGASGGWSLLATDATDSAPAFITTQARVIIQDNVMALVVPASEFSTSLPDYRVTAFRHSGDFGAQPPHDWDGDVEPPVSDPLRTSTAIGAN